MIPAAPILCNPILLGSGDKSQDDSQEISLSFVEISALSFLAPFIKTEIFLVKWSQVKD